jgi:hypothetical protein
MKIFDMTFVGWVMAMTAFLYVVFFLKTLLMESLGLGSNFVWLVDDSKTML